MINLSNLRYLPGLISISISRCNRLIIVRLTMLKALRTYDIIVSNGKQDFFSRIHDQQRHELAVNIMRRYRCFLWVSVLLVKYSIYI